MSYEPTIWKKGDKVTSTKLNKIENGIQGNDEEITSIKEDLNAFRPTATSADVGKTLIVKTVDDGVPTEFEYGEAGVSEKELSALDNRVDALIDTSQVSLDFDVVIGSYISGTGQIVREAGSLYTSKIAVTPSETLALHAEWAEYPNRFKFDLVQYDSAGEFLRKSIVISAQNPDQLAVYDGSITVPSDVYFIALDNYNYKSVNMDTVVRLYRPWELEERVSATEQDIENIQASLNGVYIAERLDATTEIETSGSPQMFNKDAYSVLDYGTSYNYYHNCYIDFTQNGKYYINPFGNAQIIKVYAYDANDNRLSINGSDNGYFGWNEYCVVERADDTHIKRYRYTGKTSYENEALAGVDVYEIGGTVAKLKCEFFRNLHYGDSVDIGITHGKPMTYYVPYGVNIKYRTDMRDALWEDFVVSNKFRDVPEKCLNPWMQRSYAITDNLLDDRKFDWTRTTSSGANVYRPMKTGETVPVIGGNTIISNKRLYNVKTYDSSGVETAVSNPIGKNTPYVLANDVVAIRFDVIIGTASDQIPANTYEPIYLYYADDTLYPLDDVDKNPVPMAQINGWDINKNVYDLAIPDVDANIVRMMKTFAVRELNHQRDAFRIGTFNIYVNNTRTNRPTIKRELETYGIDICGFQEARNLSDNNEQMNIGDYLKRGWQFDYCNTNAGVSSNGRAMVSAYEILSSEEVTFTGSSIVNNTSYLKCVIQLPQYKHYADGATTLSIYNYHGDSASATARAEQVTQIIDAVAQDTSDFIIVLGDTNDFPDNHPNWQSFIDAGLTPVHDGSSRTTTDGWSIDQIFVSEHIACLYYDVIDSRDWKYTPAGASTPIPVSDHDFLYADLQFDFEAVLSARQ